MEKTISISGIDFNLSKVLRINDAVLLLMKIRCQHLGGKVKDEVIFFKRHGLHWINIDAEKMAEELPIIPRRIRLMLEFLEQKKFIVCHDFNKQDDGLSPYVCYAAIEDRYKHISLTGKDVSEEKANDLYAAALALINNNKK